jgi:hypothetical protein
MFCPRCGTQNAADARFCRNCAHTFTQTAGQQPPAAPNPWQASAQKPPADLPYPGYQGPSAQPPSLSGYPSAPPNLQQSYASSGQQQGASGRAIASLVLMLAGFFIGCGPFLSIPALILGKQELDAIRSGQAPKAGETLAKFGFYGGIAVTILYCGLGVLYGVLIGFAGIIGAFSG